MADTEVQPLTEPEQEWGVISGRDGEIVVRVATKTEAKAEAKRLNAEQVAYRNENLPHALEGDPDRVGVKLSDDRIVDSGELVPPTQYRVEQVLAIGQVQ